MVRHRRAEH
jgi:hypothetical protein